ncbi:MAG: hypothetical protein ABW106_04410 [Steroidobacteraceae bacterium]
MVSDIVDRSIAMAACIAVFDSLPGPTAFLASLFVTNDEACGALYFRAGALALSLGIALYLTRAR